MPVPGAIEVDALLAREGLHAAILRQIRLVCVLDVVIGGYDGLCGIVHPRCADGLELLHHRRGVVVGHHVERADGEEVACSQGPARPFGHVGLRDLLDDGLAHISDHQSARSALNSFINSRHARLLLQIPDSVHGAAASVMRHYRSGQRLKLLFNFFVTERISRIALGIVELSREFAPIDSVNPHDDAL